MQILTKRTSLAIAMGSAALLAACAGPQYDQSTYSAPQPYSTYPYDTRAPANVAVGTVERIEVVPRGDSHNIAGTAIGAIVGGLIGHQIGRGTGQTAATVAGAAGGAIAGNQIERRSRAQNETFRVTVRMDNGGYQTITQDNIVDLRVGDRIRLDGDRMYRD